MIPVMIPLSFSFKSKLNDHKLINKLKRFLFYNRDRAQAIGMLEYLTVKDGAGVPTEPQKHDPFVAIRKVKEGNV